MVMIFLLNVRIQSGPKMEVCPKWSQFEQGKVMTNHEINLDTDNIRKGHPQLCLLYFCIHILQTLASWTTFLLLNSLSLLVKSNLFAWLHAIVYTKNWKNSWGCQDMLGKYQTGQGWWSFCIIRAARKVRMSTLQQAHHRTQGGPFCNSFDVDDGFLDDLYRWLTYFRWDFFWNWCSIDTLW